MPEELTAVQLEYRRRRLRIWKSAGIFILLPVGILVAVNQLAASPILTKVFAAVVHLHPSYDSFPRGTREPERGGATVPS